MSELRWQFVLGTGVSSRLIAWFGNGYGGYSHVDAIMPDGSCIGARSDRIWPLNGGPPIEPGVQERPEGYEKWKRRCVVTMAATAQEAYDWEKFLRSQIGVPYDDGDIVDFILGRQTDAKSGKWICSWLQENAAVQVRKLPVGIPTPGPQITPNSLLLMLCAAGATVGE